MKLYKITLVVSIILFLILVVLSGLFEFTCISKYPVSAFVENYLIGIACSIIVVIITTFLQFKYEQKKTLNLIISEIQFFFFHCWMVAMACGSPEEVSNALWGHHYKEIYEGLRKTSSNLSSIEWFCPKKKETTKNLQRAVIGALVEGINFSSDQEKVMNIIRSPLLKDIKEESICLAGGDDYRTQEIIQGYEKIQQELAMMEVIP